MTVATALSIELDEDGLLKDANAWDEHVAEELARRNGIEVLGADHWKIIRSLRAYHAKYGVAPAMYQVCRAHGHDRFWVHDLFHTCLNAWRVAGLPNPGEEAKSYLSDAY